MNEARNTPGLTIKINAPEAMNGNTEMWIQIFSEFAGILRHLESIDVDNDKDLFIEDNEIMLTPGYHTVRLNFHEDYRPESLRSLFASCKDIEEIRFENIDTSEVTDMSSMIAWCDKLKKVEGCEDWNTGNVTSLWALCCSCYNLEDISFLRKWDTSKVEDIDDMLTQCFKLKTLEPILDWNIERIEYRNGFEGIDENIRRDMMRKLSMM